MVNVRPVDPPEVIAPRIDELRRAQREFELFRRQRLPVWGGRSTSDRCDEYIGRYCYWYDPDEPDPPEEPASIVAARARLIALLDTAHGAHPDERWIAGQRVRYLVEAHRLDDAIAAARTCTAISWWCPALRGYALHAAGRYAAADSAFALALELMSPPQRCDWRDLKFVLDDATLRRYREQSCDSRQGIEERAWWLARPMLSLPGNDARTEYFSRQTLAFLLEESSSPYRDDFADDERELLLRYGWPTAWSRHWRSNTIGAEISVVGHEPRPAYSMIPRAPVLDAPALSDSIVWRDERGAPVRARYAPPYARRLLPLEHQAGLFRRGDSSLVVVAWSVEQDAILSAAAEEPRAVQAALVLTTGSPRDAVIVRREAPEARGTLVAPFPADSLLLSVEVVAPSRYTLARARYGRRQNGLPGTPALVSDFVLFEPTGALPARLEDVLPRMRTNERIPQGSRVGIYWESYGQRDVPRVLDVSLTVAAANPSGNWLQRTWRALRRSREARPVTMGMQDVVPPGQQHAPRAMIVDLSTLTPGRYVMELEVRSGDAVVQVQRGVSVVPRGS